MSRKSSKYILDNKYSKVFKELLFKSKNKSNKSIQGVQSNINIECNNENNGNINNITNINIGNNNLKTNSFKIADLDQVKMMFKPNFSAIKSDTNNRILDTLSSEYSSFKFKLDKSEYFETLENLSIMTRGNSSMTKNKGNRYKQEFQEKYLYYLNLKKMKKIEEIKKSIHLKEVNKDNNSNNYMNTYTYNEMITNPNYILMTNHKENDKTYKNSIKNFEPGVILNSSIFNKESTEIKRNFNLKVLNFNKKFNLI